jgi:hypothetical protein
MKKDTTIKTNKWGEEDFTRMRDFCASCKKYIGKDEKRFIVTGNYCITCSGASDYYASGGKIDVKPFL